MKYEIMKKKTRKHGKAKRKKQNYNHSKILEIFTNYAVKEKKKKTEKIVEK